MEWNEKQTLIFVKLFLSHKCLWDPSSLFYNSKYKRREAYRNLVAKFLDITNIQIDKMLVMTKIKNLRSTYARELKKLKSREGYKPKLPWFDEWHSCFWKLYSQNFKAKEVEQADSVEETNQWPDESDDNESSEDRLSESQCHEEECNSLTPETPENARMIRWNENQTKMFVKLYLRNRCLWDPTDKFFKFKFQKREAYRNLIPQFYALTNIRLNESLVMKKIRNLKKTYAYEIKKIKCRGEGYRPSLTWFDEWHSCIWKHYSQTLKATEEQADSLKETIQWPDDSDSDNDSSKDRVSESPLLKEECYLTQKPDTDIVMDTPHLKQQDRLQDQTKSTSNEDEFDVYAKFIASQMRQLDKRKVLKLQMQIHSLVNEARLEALADE